ncbi:MAG: hypothetical protein JJU34_21110 [Lunatimonas sp.]|uniref:hypothetical protein n=1 Tax=Lunatimonas sp. TaxID=2060141 RepID=UPI00263BCD5C|nr:hypothetical protein [Lunatimonas sp.]MCC5939795.1 hypothetical protein [Lunatimonas sp.]
MKFLTFNYIGFVLLAACSQSAMESALSSGYQVAVVDSIQVDYLGNLFVMDYDPASGLYLSRNNSTEEMVLFDDAGTIKEQFTFQKDGPEAVYSANGFLLSLIEGKIVLMDHQKGIHFFNPNGTFYKRINMPGEHFFIGGKSLPYYPLGERIAYLRPERGEIDWENPANIFKGIYSSPLIEVLDTLSGTVKQTMEFPPNTVYEDGNYYHGLFPIIVRNGNEWLLSLMAERKYHVYLENGNKLEYSRTVDLGLTDAVDIKGSPTIDLMYETNLFNIFGRFYEMYTHDGLTLVVYSKGIKEEISMQYDPTNSEEWASLMQGIPRYLAVFDSDHQLLGKEIPLPPGIHFTPVINHKGEFLAIKDQDFWGVEEDIVTVYKLKLSGK